MSSTQNQQQKEQHQHQQQQEEQAQQNQQLPFHQNIPTITPINPHSTLLNMQQYQATTSSDPFGTRAGLVFPDLAAPPPPPQPPLLPWNLPQIHHSFNPAAVHHHHDPFLFPSSSTSYAGLFTRRPSSSLQFAYDGLLSDAIGPMVKPGSAPFGLQHELNKMTAQEIMDAKALAASKSHSEAERRRRERINNHLAKLRSLLPNTTKTDKASLLAEVIQHVKELRRQTSIIAETTPVPTETDELTVDPATDGQDGKFIIKTTLCCDDRSDLLPDLIKALKSLRLRTLKAEITTLGGRVKNVLFVTQEPPSGDHEESQDLDHQPCSISSIQEALKAVMEKSGGGDESTSGNAKRQRTSTINIT